MRTLSRKDRFERRVACLQEGTKYRVHNPAIMSVLLKAAYWGEDDSNSRGRRSTNVEDHLITRMFSEYAESVHFFLKSIGEISIDTWMAGKRTASGIAAGFIRIHREALRHNPGEISVINRILEQIALSLMGLGGVYKKEVSSYRFDLRMGGDEWWDRRSGFKNGPLFTKTYNLIKSILLKEEARVAELADAPDSKSGSLIGCAGSSPASGTSF